MTRCWIVLAALLIGGCVANTPVPVPDETITQKEINAAAAMDMEPNREGALKSLALRQNLSQSDQVYLVKTIFGKLQEDQTKVNLLTILLQNPTLGNAPKGVILDGLKDGMKEDIARRQIFQLVQERGPIEDEVTEHERATTRRAAATRRTF